MAITRLGPNQLLNLASNVTGTLPTGNGGTGATSFTAGKLLQFVNQEENTAFNTTSSSACLLYTSPSPRDRQKSRMPSSA